MSCFGHNLDLVIRKVLSFPRFQQAFARCHSLVELFHRSGKKLEICDKNKRNWIFHNTTHGWCPYSIGIYLQQISRILEQQQAISAIMAGERIYWNKMPTDAEFTTLENLSDVLKPRVFSNCCPGWRVASDGFSSRSYHGTCCGEFDPAMVRVG